MKKTIIFFSLILGGLSLWRCDEMPSSRGKNVNQRDFLTDGGQSAIQNLNPKDNHTSSNISAADFDASQKDATQNSSPSTSTPQTTRDKYQWPFSRFSIWNMPIGDKAQYIPADIDLGRDGYNYFAGELERIYLDPQAAVEAVYQNNDGWSGSSRCDQQGGEITNGRLLSTWLIPAAQPNWKPNNSSAFLDEDVNLVNEAQPLTHCAEGGPFTAGFTAGWGGNWGKSPINGDGRVGSHGASSLSALGGTIRMGELRPGQTGPRHALKMTLWCAKNAYACSNSREDCFRWPAFGADGYAQGVYGGNNPALKMGALLALKPGAKDDLGLGSEPAKQIAWTLENYGAYLVDDSYWGATYLGIEAGGHGDFEKQFKDDYGINFEISDWGGDNSAWASDLRKIYNALHVVDNNAPNAIGGGGNPRQCYAPAFSDGLLDLITQNPNGKVQEPAGCPSF